jgi:single-stranded-DNA-specific exonuclease
VIPPRHDWILPEPRLDPPAFAGFGLPVATLLSRRGFRDDAGLAAFLNAGAEALHDVTLMADASRALDRLAAALDAGERIAIWGDYDADGMTAIAIWMIALRALGADALRYVPSRLAEGYGLSETGLRELHERGATLVMTCDCGVSNASEVEVARALGMDVIVTDHHVPPAELPRAVAVVDPHRPDCPYPDPELTGAGVAYKLAAALLARRGASAADLAGLAAIGTVADVAPMTGESRAIVRIGLAELATTERAGLRALLARACDDPRSPTARDLAFGVAPRINAAGRIAEAELAIALLIEEEAARAEQLADQLEAVNRERRELSVAAVDSAQRELSPEQVGASGPLALAGDWPVGILGLIAGRLADSLGRPVAVATAIGDELRGSVRSPADFHVAAALAACGEHLTKRGGHAAAGGFSLPAARWQAFAAAFGALSRPFGVDASAAATRGGLTIDLVLPARYLGWQLADEIARLAPFGPGHAEPLLAVTGLRVADARRVGAEGQHLALRMRRGAEVFDAIAFNTPLERPLPESGSDVDLAATLERDEFQGVPRLRLRMLDYCDAAVSPLAARRAAARTAIPVDVPERATLAVGAGAPV